jgi:hypothetical protein
MHLQENEGATFQGDGRHGGCIDLFVFVPGLFYAFFAFFAVFRTSFVFLDIRCGL